MSSASVPVGTYLMTLTSLEVGALAEPLTVYGDKVHVHTPLSVHMVMEFQSQRPEYFYRSEVFKSAHGLSEV